MKGTFIKGFWALLPTAITIIVIVKIYELVSGTIGKGLWHVAVWAAALATQQDVKAVEQKVPQFIGVILAIVIIYFVGLALALFVGRRVWAAAEARVRKVPFINSIYPPIKQVSEFFLEEKKVSFGKAVALEYPRKGIWSVGFVTGRALWKTEAAAGKEMVSVFMPSSPTPFTGYCIQVSADEVTELGIPVEEALKYVISGGVILPEGQEGMPGMGGCGSITGQGPGAQGGGEAFDR